LMKAAFGWASNVTDASLSRFDFHKDRSDRAQWSPPAGVSPMMSPACSVTSVDNVAMISWHRPDHLGQIAALSGLASTGHVTMVGCPPAADARFRSRRNCRTPPGKPLRFWPIVWVRSFADGVA
jgi:hypothetical protein